MKAYYLFFVFVSLLFISSCTSIKISSDYDENIDFTKYKTYAFYKNGIDKVEISDLDKKRSCTLLKERWRPRVLKNQKNLICW